MMGMEGEKNDIPPKYLRGWEESYSGASKKLLPRNTEETILPVELMVPSLSELDSESLLPE